ncbi:adenylate kinase [Capsaspora owczarzaki ATCC 30864]|uniref:UMP-CMP kinase n=1 Tax=Capsaspora owczarzaki (strain ATCC 30864) TaxID=595528 RepID=A0A0D2W1M1_CAPO3|nr:adenylate kinase [Capsaspora owczarzaki ATCC 30864]KJE98217.1 adenylate kinase [Capsaspora owczarzaki ATCC 30864]|eukprot:XP_004342470.1 adenylate kinase [Capsaspora owczarzaki ATCC 30864]
MAFVTATAALHWMWSRVNALIAPATYRAASSKATASGAEKPHVVFVLGGPGSGKGTQCERIVQEFGFVHLSAGDLLRAERAKPASKNGELIDKYIREGKIVPVQITCTLLAEAMALNPTKSFLIDGFPRNQDNVAGWDAVVGPSVNLDFVLFFDCPEATCVQRALQRGLTSGRTDDNKESLTKRFHTYESETMPIVNYFDRKGLVRKIDSTRSVDEVFADVKKVFAARK